MKVSGVPPKADTGFSNNKFQIYLVSNNGVQPAIRLGDIDHAKKNLFCHIREQRRTRKADLHIQILSTSVWDRPYGHVRGCWLYSV
jgi:hypothetical protein